MRMRYSWFVFLFASLSVGAQEIKVEFDKDRDFTKYKTFTFGQSEVVTPKDQKLVSDATWDKWIKTAVKRELELKGLHEVDSLADLVITYAAGTVSRTDLQTMGPLGLTPGANPERSALQEYRQTSLIIDLNDRNDFLIWRINSTTNMTTQEADRYVDQIIQKGFRKFGNPPKKKK